MHQAKFSSRFGAMILDSLLYGGLVQALSYAMAEVDKDLAVFVVPLLWLFGSIVYYVYPTYKYGQTLGKKFLAIKVISTKKNSEELNLFQAFSRETFGKFLSALTLGLGYIWSIFHPQKKTFHDLLANTSVISLKWEEEFSVLRMLKKLLIVIFVLPFSTAALMGVLLYTSLPLPSIKEKIEAAGIQVGELSGSIAGGLRFSELAKQDGDQRFALNDIVLKVNLQALILDKTFLVEHASAESGNYEVPEGFSLVQMLTLPFLPDEDPVRVSGKAQKSPVLTKLVVAKFYIKNLLLKSKGKVMHKFSLLSLTNLNFNEEGVHVDEFKLATEGLTLQVKDFNRGLGRVQWADATGGVGPEFLPVLKVLTDFQVKGNIGKTSKSSQVEGSLVMGKVKFSFGKEKYTAHVDKLVLNELVKTSMPIEELDLKWDSEGKSFVESAPTAKIDNKMKFCGMDFLPTPEGLVYQTSQLKFNVAMRPKPVDNFLETLFRPEASLDSFFSYQLSSSAADGPKLGTEDTLAHLCYNKSIAELGPNERSRIDSFVKAGLNVGTSSFGLVVSAQYQQDIQAARVLFGQGKMVEALAELEKLAPMAQLLPPKDQGAYFSFKGWVYLYSGKKQESFDHFKQAFDTRQDLADVEGMLRASEQLDHKEESQKWLKYLTDAVKEKPELLGRLSQNMQRKIASEVPQVTAPASNPDSK